MSQSTLNLMVFRKVGRLTFILLQKDEKGDWNFLQTPSEGYEVSHEETLEKLNPKIYHFNQIQRFKFPFTKAKPESFGFQYFYETRYTKGNTFWYPVQTPILNPVEFLFGSNGVNSKKWRTRVIKFFSRLFFLFD